MRVINQLHWSALCRCCKGVKVGPEPVYRLDDNMSKDEEIDRSEQNLIRRLNDRLVVSTGRGHVI